MAPVEGVDRGLPVRSNGEGGTSAFSDLGRACGPAAMAQTAHWNLRSAQPSRCSKVEDLRVGIQGAGREGEQVGVLCTSRKSGRVAFKAMAISSGPCRTFQTRPSVVAIQRPKIRIVAGQTGTPTESYRGHACGFSTRLSVAWGRHPPLSQP